MIALEGDRAPRARGEGGGALEVAPPRPLRIVAAGGGTGLPRVLAGLGQGIEPEGGRRVDVTALVTTADDGGSSGELRRRYGVPAPGDVRSCLVALAGGLNPLAAVFAHRFEGEGGLAGHTVGNVILTALAQRLGDFGAAVEAAARMLGVRGHVVPGATAPVELVAELDDGRVLRGETAIAAGAGGRIARLALSGPAEAPRAAIEAIEAADLVVLGPGSLYSSVLASLLAGGIGDALHATRALRVLVVNLFTQPGETDGHAASDHVRAVQRHLGDAVDVALVHRPPLPAAAVARLAERGAAPVEVDRAAVEALDVVPFAADVASAIDPGRHDPAKLARALLAAGRLRGAWEAA